MKANHASDVRVPDVHLGFSALGAWMDFVQGTMLTQRKSLKGNYYKNDMQAVAAFRSAAHRHRNTPRYGPPDPHRSQFFRRLPVRAQVPHSRTSRGTDKRGMAFRSLLVPRIKHSRALVATEVLRPLGNNVNFQTETADGLVLCPSDPPRFQFCGRRRGKTVSHISAARASCRPLSCLR